MQPCNTSCAEDHIFRRRKTDGTRPELEPMNIYESYEDISTRMKRIKIEHKSHFGQKLQPHARPIREIVVIEMTQKDQALKFIRAIEKEYGIQVLGFAIHKDEGHYDIDTSEWIPNNHAHFIIDLTIWTHEPRKVPKRIHGQCVRDPETGAVVMLIKDCYGMIHHFSKDELSRLQDIAAEIVHLGRGKQSTRKHIGSQEFRAAELKKDIEILENRKEQLENSITKIGEALVHCGDKIQERTRRTISELNAVLQKYHLTLPLKGMMKEALSAPNPKETIHQPLNDADIFPRINYYEKCVEQSNKWEMIYISVVKQVYKRLNGLNKTLSLLNAAKRWLCAALNKPADNQARKLISVVKQLSKAIIKVENTNENVKAENEKLKEERREVYEKYNTVKAINKDVNERMRRIDNDKSETLKHLLSLNLSQDQLDHLAGLKIPKLLGDAAWNQLTASVSQRAKPNNISKGLHR